MGDITCLRTGPGWLYLATVIDLATRMVSGWQLADHMRTSLVTGALDMAIGGGHAPPGAIFHSDRGTQYRSADFARFCQASGIATSTGRTGVCWDNAAAESFFGALKNEMYYRQAFPDCAARSAVADYIEVFYNRRRLPPWATAPRRSPHRLPDRSSHCMINPEELSKIVDTPHRCPGGAARRQCGNVKACCAQRLAQWAEVPGAPPGRGDVGSHATSLRDRLTTSPRLRRTSVNRLKNLPA